MDRAGIRDIAVKGARADPRMRGSAPADRLGVPVFAGELYRHRARFRGRYLQRGERRLAAHAATQGDHQPAVDGRAHDAERLRRSDRMDVARTRAARFDRAFRSSAQRPRLRRRLRRARAARRCGANRRMPVRQRRAHGQRLPRDAWSQPVHAGCRPRHRLLRHQRDHPHGRALQSAAGPSPPPLRRRPRVHRVFRLAPGRDQEGTRRARDRDGARQSRYGTFPICPSIPPTSDAPTTR